MRLWFGRKDTSEYVLKNDNVTKDKRMDRIVQFDERSRNFPVMATIENPNPRSFTWPCDVYNDQGKEGACVGFAWSHELAAKPVVIPTNNKTALSIYNKAKTLDEWPGEEYSGTSVLAGAKAVQSLVLNSGKHAMPEYRWAFGVDDLQVAVGRKGPAVLGVKWYDSMYTPDSLGFIRPVGNLVGGHAILCRGVKFTRLDNTKPLTLDNVDRDRSYFILRNSWGRKWGKQGDCYITVRDMDTLLQQDGEACIPTLRRSE